MEDKKTKKASKEDVIKFNFHNKIKNLFFRQNIFLNSIDEYSLERENKSYPLIKYVIGFYFIFFIISLIISLAINKNFSQITLSSLISIILIAIFTPIFIFLLISILNHFLVIIFRGKEGFFNTYKVVSFVFIMGVVYSFLLMVLNFLIPFDYSGLQNSLMTSSNLTDIIKNGFKFIFSDLKSGVNTLVSFAILIHITFFWIKGISKFHKLNYIKAIFIVILTEAFILVYQVLKILQSVGTAFG
ncbi:MAG: YIP1 family protein [Candidatus Pacearchaeota archaeon]